MDQPQRAYHSERPRPNYGDSCNASGQDFESVGRPKLFVGRRGAHSHRLIKHRSTAQHVARKSDAEMPTPHIEDDGRKREEQRAASR
jgi:hypothetical protein